MEFKHTSIETEKTSAEVPVFKKLYVILKKVQLKPFRCCF